MSVKEPADKAKMLLIRRELIGKYIKLRNVGTPSESLYINFDGLVQALMAHPKMRFSASLFEQFLEKEIKEKILGRLMDQETFAKVCDYIWDLGIYCTAQKIKNEDETFEMLKQRAELAKKKRMQQ